MNQEIREPMTNTYIKNEANEEFNRARFQEFLRRIGAILNPERQELLSLQEVREALRPRKEHYRGMQVVDIDLIVGSEGRYRDFNKQFLPKSEHLRHRWTRVDEAHLSDVILPPIKLYEIGGVYFVRDGNHRVSVARSQGVEKIDAEVVVLDSEIKLEPNLTRETLLKAVIAYERRVFCERMRWQEVLPDVSIDFTAPGRYDEIVRHIYEHKYYINQGLPEEIPVEQAMRSWYENVYRPIIDIIADDRIGGRFPGRTQADMYVWIVKHWHELKERYGDDFSLKDAATDFSARYGKGFWHRVSETIGRPFAALFGKKRPSHPRGHDDTPGHGDSADNRHSRTSN